MGMGMSASRGMWYLTFHLIFEESKNATRLVGETARWKETDSNLLGVHR